MGSSKLLLYRCFFVIAKLFLSGIDIPDCNVVVRFNEIQTFKSFVQSRGRARARDSRLIVMVPEGDARKVQERLDEVNISDLQKIWFKLKWFFWLGEGIFLG